ncbi:retrovirus-related pol polyprotein from transposon TNT 1-94 [Tanacetum coccineum]
MDENVRTFKYRLVAKRFTQTQGVECDETFSLVSSIKAVRILIAITEYYDYEIWQMDVNTAFLYGHLSEDVYMVKPEGLHRKNPSEAPWTAAKNILRYFRHAKDMLHVYGGLIEELIVRCYTDTNFQTNQNDTRSQPRYVFTLNGGAIIWKSSEQSTIAMSTTQSEYIAALEATKQWNPKLADMTNAKYNSQDEKAHITILLSLLDEVLYEVADEEMAVEGSSLKEHLDALNSILMDLKNVEVKIEDEDATLVLLVSLPPSFESFVSLFVVGKDTITLEDVRSSLHSKELRQQASGSGGKECQSMGLLTTSRDRGRYRFKKGKDHGGASSSS